MIRPTRSLNEQLALRAIRQAVNIERYKNSVATELAAVLYRDVLPDIEVQLYRGLGAVSAGESMSFSDRRLRALARSLKETLEGGMATARDMLESRLLALATSESEIAVLTFRNTVLIPFDWVAPSPALLERIARLPVQGKILKTWFARLSADAQVEIRKQLDMGLVEGESIPQLVGRMRGSSQLAYGDGAFPAIRQHVEAVARTAVGQVSTEVRDATYAANSEVVKGVQICATLDERTCEICMGLDGEELPPGKGPRPPFHFSCRCTTAPVLKSWRELGIKAKDIPEGTRASMDGQAAGKIAYGDWLKAQPRAIQNEALGPARAELFRSGKVKADQFVSDYGRRLTLDQLRKKAGILDGP